VNQLVNTPAGDKALVDLANMEGSILELKKQFAIVPDAKTDEGYEQCRNALGQLVGTRTAIKKRGKEMREGALLFQRQVLAVENKLLDAIKDIEEPIRCAKDLVDIEREKEAAARRNAVIDKQLAEMKARADAAEAEARKMREAEEARLAEERKKLEAEKLEMKKKQAEEEAHRKLLEEENARLRAKEDAVRLEAAKIQAAVEERKRLEFEAAKKAIEDKAEAARLEAMKPDIQLVHEFGLKLRSLSCTLPKSPEAKAAIESAFKAIGLVGKMLLAFNGK
jgi:hypothetical protein